MSAETTTRRAHLEGLADRVDTLLGEDAGAPIRHAGVLLEDLEGNRLMLAACAEAFARVGAELAVLPGDGGAAAGVWERAGELLRIWIPLGEPRRVTGRLCLPSGDVSVRFTFRLFDQHARLRVERIDGAPLLLSRRDRLSVELAMYRQLVGQAVAEIAELAAAETLPS